MTGLITEACGITACKIRSCIPMNRPEMHGFMKISPLNQDLSGGMWDTTQSLRLAWS